MNTDGHFPIGTRFGNYELTAFLGEGGMGTVYAAVHLGLGKRVAIKTLRADLAADIDLRMRFLREGKAAAAVRHPNVVDVDDVGVAGETPYLVMELLEGEDLGARVQRAGRLSVEETADTIVPVLMAMSEAHRSGVVHRDLKPDNIFLARHYHGATVPKVLDFGISKLREAQSMGLTGNNTMLGTPYYMSPEQAGSARDVDARSDLYSIGVILYHCVSGRVPFAGTSLVQVIGQILHAQPIPPRELGADAPEAFEAVILRSMAKDPGQRHMDALSLARELLPFSSPRIQLSYGAFLHSASSLPAVPAISAATVLNPPTPIPSQPRSQQRSAAGAPAQLSTQTPLAHSIATPAPTSSVGSWRMLAIGVLVAAVSAALLFALKESRNSNTNTVAAPPITVTQPVPDAAPTQDSIGNTAPIKPNPNPDPVVEAPEPVLQPTPPIAATPTAPARPTGPQTPTVQPRSGTRQPKGETHSKRPGKNRPVASDAPQPVEPPAPPQRTQAQDDDAWGSRK